MQVRPLKSPRDPEEKSFRRGFVWSCRKHGLNYEHVIGAVYRRAAERWTPGYVIDGGAHKGLHTLPLASLPTVGRVVAFEPGAEALAVLEQRVRGDRNGQKIEIVPAALQEDPARDRVRFHVSTNHPGRSGINPILMQRNDTDYAPPADVPATTIDRACLSRPGACRFIKLDLEGGEYNALRGGMGLLTRDTPLMVFENGRHAPEIGGYAREDFLALLERAGMVFVTAFGDIGTPSRMNDFWYAWACAKGDARRTRRLVRAEAGKVFRTLRAGLDLPGVARAARPD